jgi:hypothetical protein
MAADDKIDTLFQLPLDEFTAARNELAKATGDASVKKLEKPNLAAWAVNQLYWHQRKLYDEVIKTSGQVRAAYKQMLAGKSANVKAAENLSHRGDAQGEGRHSRMLEAAGNSAVDGVMTPITETLDALPTTDPPGRLTKPLRRTGFEALQGVTIAAKPSTPVAKPEPKKPAPTRPSASARSARPISKSSRWRRSACDSRKRRSAKRKRRSIAPSERWIVPSGRASASKASWSRRRRREGARKRTVVQRVGVRKGEGRKRAACRKNRLALQARPAPTSAPSRPW